MSRQIFISSIFLVFFNFFKGQEFFSDYPLWEKEDGLRIETQSQNTNRLLNFHDKISFTEITRTIPYQKQNAHSLFIVHASEYDELVWKNNYHRVALRNKKFKKLNVGKQIPLAHQPSIYSYVHLGEISTDKEKGHIDLGGKHVYEVLFIPKKIGSKKRAIVHSYLSLKYGISLIKGKYYNSKRKVLWDSEKEEDFSYRPTGIGRDDGTSLYQKQSSNQSTQFLTIGHQEIKARNSENKSVFEDQQFVIWSDNNGALSYQKDGDDEKLQRRWRIYFMGKNISKSHYQLRIPLLSEGDSLYYYLILNTEGGKEERIQGKKEGDWVIFNEVDFKTSRAEFTFATSVFDEKEEAEKEKSKLVKTNADMNKNHLTLYPNPVSKNQLFSISDLSKLKGLSLHIFDGSGRLVYQQKLSQDTSVFQYRLPAEGVYIINLRSQGQLIKTFKLIVE